MSKKSIEVDSDLANEAKKQKQEIEKTEDSKLQYNYPSWCLLTHTNQHTKKLLRVQEKLSKTMITQV